MAHTKTSILRGLLFSSLLHLTLSHDGGKTQGQKYQMTGERKMGLVLSRGNTGGKLSSSSQKDRLKA